MPDSPDKPEEKPCAELTFDDFFSQVNLMDLALFEQVALQLSISKAAESLDGMTESTASRRLRRIEELLGNRLFERTTRQMALTEVGEAYLPRVLDILHAFRELHRLTGVVHTQTAGPLRVGAGPFITEILSCKFLGQFILKHPDITLSLKLIPPESLDDAVGQLDLVIIGKLPASQSVGLRHLGQFKNYFWASPEYLQRHSPPTHPRELTQHCFLTIRDKSLSDHHISWTDSDQVTYREPLIQPFYCDTASTLIHLATQGVGILLAPSLLVQDEQDKLTVLFDGQYGPMRELYAIFPSARLMPRKVAIFLSELERFIKQSATKS